MQLANVIIKDKYDLDPMLAELVTPLALSMPSYTFTTRTMDETQYKYWSSGTTVKNRAITAGEGREFIRKVFVFCEDENLGELSVDTKYSRSNGNVAVWDIRCWRISNERGARNCTRTSKLDVAKRVVKKHFLPKAFDEILQNESSILYDYDRALHRLASDITRSSLLRNNADLQVFVYRQLTKQEVPTQIKTYLETMMRSNKYEKAMGQFELAVSMEGRKDRLVIIRHKGGYLYKQDVVKGEDLTEAVTMFQMFEELPSLWQDRIAVLQLMEDEEVVRDVGYRRDADNFVILTN